MMCHFFVEVPLDNIYDDKDSGSRTITQAALSFIHTAYASVRYLPRHTTRRELICYSCHGMYGVPLGDIRVRT